MICVCFLMCLICARARAHARSPQTRYVWWWWWWCTMWTKSPLTPHTHTHKTMFNVSTAMLRGCGIFCFADACAGCTFLNRKKREREIEREKLCETCFTCGSIRMYSIRGVYSWTSFLRSTHAQNHSIYLTYIIHMLASASTYR